MRVQRSEAVFNGGSSSNALQARALAERVDITIITVSHYIAQLLRDATCEVIVLGGLLQKSSESVVGPLTRYSIQQVHFHRAFVGVDGWHLETGFTGRNMLRCDVVDAVLAKGAESYALTDASKFGQIHPYPLSSGYQVGHVITDETLDVGTVTQLREQAIKVIQIAAN